MQIMTKRRSLAWLTVILCAVLLTTDSAVAAAPGFFSQPSNPTTLNGTGNLSMQVIASAATSFPLTFYWYKTNALVYTWTTNGNLGCTFVISNAVPPDGGNYQIILSNSFGMATGTVFTVTIKNPYLAVSPNSLSAPEGVTTNLTSLALGTDSINYFWYRKITGVSTNIVSTGSSNVVFTPLARTNGGIYFVVASNVWGAVTSSTVTLTVNFKPAITNISVTNIIAEINSSVFSAVQYEASPNPFLYWFKDAVYQPSLSGSSLSFPSVQATNAGSYQLVVSNFLGSVTSAPIVLIVKPARGPTITNQPTARVVKVGDQFTLTAGVDGTPILKFALFQQGVGQVGSWSSGSIPYVTATTTNFTGQYYIVVTNNYGSATSQLASVTVLLPQPASFNGKQFVKIADSLTTIPGASPLKFGSFREAFIRGNQVWFGGGVSGVPFSMGVYNWSNSVITKLVDTNTLAPGSAGRFTNFYGSTFLSNGKVIFDGRTTGGDTGIYAWTNGSVIKLYDNHSVIPTRSDTFIGFGWPTVVGNRFAFLGFSALDTNNFLTYRGVFLDDNGVLSKLADTNSLLPHVGGYFRGSSSQVGFDGTNVSWWAWNETVTDGIFRVSPTTPITNLADILTPNPATSQNFNGFISPPTVYNGRTYLVGHNANFKTTLLYQDLTGPLTVVAKPGDTVPARGIAFDSVGYPAQASSSAGVFFDGSDGGGYYGTYFWDGTNTTKVIDNLDSLDGQTISYVYTADADGDNLLFYVNFSNGQTALYAMIPAGQTFSQWLTGYTFPPGLSDPEDDADGDGILNVFEFYFGSNPTNSASGAQPTITSANVSGQDYPAITFIRSKNVGGVTLNPQASSDVLFSNSLGTTVASVVDLGNGTEQVTIRSNTSMAALATQFLRIQLAVP